MPQATYSAVLLDLDGTVTDSATGIIRSVEYALKRLEIEPGTIDLHCFVGPPLELSFRKHFGLEKNDSWRAVEMYREYFNDRGIYENRLYPGMASLIRRLHETECAIALTTAKPTVYARKILTHFNVGDCFDTIVGSHMDGRRTDKAELIKTTLNLLPDHAYEKPVMVGDREHDIIGAKQAGIESIGVLWGYGSSDELSDATYIAKDVRDLEEILTQQKEPGV